MTKEKEALFKTMKDQAQRHYKTVLTDTELLSEYKVKLGKFNKIDSLVAKHGKIREKDVHKLFDGHCDCHCDHVYHPDVYPPEEETYWEGISQETEKTLTAEAKKGEIKCAHAEDRLQKAKEGTQWWREILTDHKAGR